MSVLHAEMGDCPVFCGNLLDRNDHGSCQANPHGVWKTGKARKRRNFCQLNSVFVCGVNTA